MLARELVAKQLQILKEVVPKVSRVALLWNPANPSTPVQRVHAEDAARASGVRLEPMEVRGPGDIDRAFATMTRERAGAIIVPVEIALEGWLN
jgi:putative tryptophan/tyrosine transport system substrate-binding protein